MPGSKHDRCHSESFRHFVQQNRDKDENSHFEIDEESGCNRNTVEESVNPKTTDSSVRGGRAHERLRMGFGAEVKVRCECVLEQLYQKISGEKQRHRAHDGFGGGTLSGAFGPDVDCRWENLDEDRGEHDTCAECDEGFQ